MKKLLIMATATLLAYGAEAQTTQGRFAVTGALGYTHGTGSSDQEENGIKQTNKGVSYTVSPSLGYFIKDNLEIGAGMRYEKNESEWTILSSNISGYSHERKRDELNVYARQYKYLHERIALHATLSAGIGTSTQSSTFHHSRPHMVSRHDSNYARLRTVSLSPGITFFPSDRLALSANLGAIQYTHSAHHTTNWEKYQGTPVVDSNIHRHNYTTNSFGFDLSSMGLNLGLSLFIGK